MFSPCHHILFFKKLWLDVYGYTVKEIYDIPGFILTKPSRTGIGYIIPGQREFGK